MVCRGCRTIAASLRLSGGIKVTGDRYILSIIHIMSFYDRCEEEHVDKEIIPDKKSSIEAVVRTRRVADSTDMIALLRLDELCLCTQAN